MAHIFDVQIFYVIVKVDKSLKFKNTNVHLYVVDSFYKYYILEVVNWQYQAVLPHLRNKWLWKWKPWIMEKCFSQNIQPCLFNMSWLLANGYKVTLFRHPPEVSLCCSSKVNVNKIFNSLLLTILISAQCSGNGSYNSVTLPY